MFYSYLDFVKPGQRLLDLACGDGLDLENYIKLGAEVSGIDASEELVSIARKKLPTVDIQVGVFEALPYPDESFDVVLSKYAIQTAHDVEPCFKEVHRVLKPGGMLMYLVVHPMRQYFEKRDEAADYFEQKIVDSHILGNTITVREPTHTFNEYLSEWFLESFDLKLFREYWDAAAEQIGGKKYPGYFIVKVQKR